jgi:hypothetical protein
MVETGILPAVLQKHIRGGMPIGLLPDNFRAEQKKRLWLYDPFRGGLCAPLNGSHSTYE